VHNSDLFEALDSGVDHNRTLNLKQQPMIQRINSFESTQEGSQHP